MEYGQKPCPQIRQKSFKLACLFIGRLCGRKSTFFSILKQWKFTYKIFAYFPYQKFVSQFLKNNIKSLPKIYLTGYSPPPTDMRFALNLWTTPHVLISPRYRDFVKNSLQGISKTTPHVQSPTENRRSVGGEEYPVLFLPKNQCVKGEGTKSGQNFFFKF